MSFDAEAFLTGRDDRPKPAPRTVRFAGRDWQIPGVRPYALDRWIVAPTIAAGVHAVEALFGDDLPDLLALQPSEDDVTVLLAQVILPAYRLVEDPQEAAEVPNSSGSQQPSEPTEEPSSPTSTGTTSDD